jgi:type 1 glutamine amidotransferase
MRFSRRTLFSLAGTALFYGAAPSRAAQRFRESLGMSFGRASGDSTLVPALLITGDNHPAHHWRETTPAIVAALNNPTQQFDVTVGEDPEVLAKGNLSAYKLIVLNYCNWNHGGLSDAAKRNFVDYLHRGAGLTIIHFSNGAFHFSLPNEGGSDWPEYRKICARVWDHTPGKSEHDSYGAFRVNIVDRNSPITAGIKDYDATDELYFNQQGDVPIHILATARSKKTGKDEPMAFNYQYGPARVFQLLLGHDVAAIRASGTTQFIRNGSLWAAKLPE